jgi:hypothetical protein
MSDHDAIQDDAGRRLKRQADLTAYVARRFSEAVRQGDLTAARRWRHEYQLSAACCRALGRQARGEGTTAGTTLQSAGTTLQSAGTTRRSAGTTRPSGGSPPEAA